VTEGLGVSADAYIIRSDPLFAEVDRAITKYPLDPGRALDLLGEAGWRRDAGGSLTNDANQTLDLGIMSTTVLGRTTTIIGDSWKTIGANPTLQILSQAAERDRQLRVSFPATQLAQRSISMSDFNFVSSQVPTREAGYAESNRGSFRDAEVDRLHHIAVTALESQVRAAAEVDLHKRLSSLAAFIPLHYSVEVLLARNRLRGPLGYWGPQLGVTWNIFEWSLAP
jgi:ABC-type transport system substrate-binding protein